MRAFAVLPHPFALAARVYAAVVSVKTAWDRRKLVGEMAGFDDHMLRDIGLTRGDIQCALADPLTADPTWRLAVRAHEARSNRRAAALERRRWGALLADPAAEATEPGRRAA